MSKYLYNGIELPALPEWDKTTYPYARLTLSSGTYYLRTADNYAYITAAGFMYCAAYKGYDYNFKLNDKGEWEKTEGSPVYHTVPVIFNGQNETFWSNYDILNEDGSVWLAASDPVPVGGEPEEPETPEQPVPTLTTRDLYRKINGKLTKLTLYKKLGGELVKVDEYST